MTQAKVFHAHRTADDRMYDPRYDGAWPLDDEHYTLAATVELADGMGEDDAREYAFECTNSVDRPWWGNEGVTIHIALTKARSTSVGDVVTLDSGAFRVERIGWRIGWSQVKR